MRNKIMLGLIAVTFILGFFAFKTRSDLDRMPPVLTATGEIVYNEGDDYSVLLDGVTANDAKDGDVTQTLIVEKVQYGTDTATVYYAAKDSSNNVGKLTRIVLYSANKEVVEPEKTYKVMLVNNLGIQNLATNWGDKLSKDGHNITAIGLSEDVVQDRTIIYAKDAETGSKFLKYFPTAMVTVGDISRSVNVAANGAEVFIVLGNNDVTM